MSFVDIMLYIHVLAWAMILDMAPRIAVPVVFTTGVYLAHASYGVQVPPLGIGIGLGFVWLAVVAIGVLNPPETKLGARMQKLNLGINFIALIAMGGLGMASLLGANYFPGWLAAKWLAYAWIALFAIGIDIACLFVQELKTRVFNGYCGLPWNNGCCLFWSRKAVLNALNLIAYRV